MEPFAEITFGQQASKYFIDGAPASILDSAITITSECLLALQSPAVLVSFNNEFPSSHIVPPMKRLDGGNRHSMSVPSNRNYLAILTLAWSCVLSSYWAEVQNRVIEYTTSRAPLPAKK
jgi:hypothetical protein